MHLRLLVWRLSLLQCGTLAVSVGSFIIGQVLHRAKQGTVRQRIDLSGQFNVRFD